MRSVEPFWTSQRGAENLKKNDPVYFGAESNRNNE